MSSGFRRKAKRAHLRQSTSGPALNVALDLEEIDHDKEHEEFLDHIEWMRDCPPETSARLDEALQGIPSAAWILTRALSIEFARLRTSTGLDQPLYRPRLAALAQAMNRAESTIKKHLRLLAKRKLLIVMAPDRPGRLTLALTPMLSAFANQNSGSRESIEDQEVTP